MIVNREMKKIEKIYVMACIANAIEAVRSPPKEESPRKQSEIQEVVGGREETGLISPQ